MHLTKALPFTFLNLSNAQSLEGDKKDSEFEEAKKIVNHL